MTSTIRKRAERLRRKEAGEVRVEVWLSENTAAELDWLEGVFDANRSGTIEIAIQALAAYHQKRSK